MRLSRAIVALLAGALFGFGLSLSGMLDPTRVRGFLDVFGAWDPSLGFVLVGAVLVAGLGTLIRRAAKRPLLDERFHLPEKTGIDRSLILGSVLFGVGWGMAGLCPGPAVADLGFAGAPALGFVVAMLAGMILHDRLIAGPRC
jgi:uncharacterized protein